MKNKTMLLLLVAPLLFACGNKGGDESSSTNPVDTSSSSPIDTSTTSTNVDPSTSEEEPPVEPEVQTPEEMFGYPDVSEVVDLSLTTIPNEILAKAVLNMDKCRENTHSYLDWYVFTNSTVYVPNSTTGACLEERTSNCKYYETAEVDRSHYFYEEQYDGHVSYKNESIDEDYYWYDFTDTSHPKYCNYSETTGIVCSTDSVSYSESSTAITLEDAKEEISSCAVDLFYSEDIPTHVFSGPGIGYVNGYYGDGFVFSYEYSYVDYYYFNDDIIPQQCVEKHVYIVENIEGIGYAFTKYLSIYYYYFLSGAYGIEFDAPRYSDYGYERAEFFYDDIGEFTTPKMKYPTHASIPAGYEPTLSSYSISSSKFSLLSRRYLTRLSDAIVNDELCARFAIDVLDLDPEYLYIISSGFDSLNITNDNAETFGETIIKPDDILKGYTNYPGDASFYVCSYCYATLTVYVDIYTGAMSLGEFIVY